MYEPGSFGGASLEELRLYVDGELQRIAALFSEMELDSFRFVIQRSEPAKPRDGHVYLADGTNWDPGYGKGLYLYLDGEWLSLTNQLKSERPRFRTLRLISYAPKVTNTTIRKQIPAATLTLSSLAPNLETTFVKKQIPSATLTLTGF